MSLFSQLAPGAATIAKDLVQKATRHFGRTLTPQELAQIEQHAASLSRPANTAERVGLDMTAEGAARARHDLATNPNIKNATGMHSPDTAQDEFLTKQLVGRTLRGTTKTPKTLDIAAPEVGERMEMAQLGGHLDDLIPGASQGNITPSASYLANMSDAATAKALAATGQTDKIPLLDKLKAAHAAKTGKYPTDEELEQLIAAYNPARHQYGPKGASVVLDRPPSAKGMQDWKANARLEGIEESAINFPPARYPEYLSRELDFAKGISPADKEVVQKVRKARDIAPVEQYMEDGVPVNVYPPIEKAEGGRITPREMLAEMTVSGHNVPHMAEGGLYSRAKEVVKPTWNKAFNLLNLLEIPEVAKAAMSGKYAKAGEGATDIAAAFVPSILGMGGYQLGKLATNTAGNMLRDNPAHQAQMEAMGSDELGGALTGDAALAAHILKNSR